MTRPRHVVVVGADAAGMGAAHQALRTAAKRGEALAVTALEASGHTSYSACGIPYWMAGDVDSGDDLVARTADQHREAGIDLRLGTEVVAADLAARTVTTAAGEVLEYDDLVVATGALRMREAYAALEGPVLVLVAAMIPVSDTVQASGGADLIAGWLSGAFHGLPPLLTLTSSR